jgi:tight adherence protein B
MLIAAATFVLCAVIIGGSYWLFVLRPEKATVRRVVRRLTPEPTDRPRRHTLTKKVTPLSALKTLDMLLAHSGDVTEPVQRTIALSALPITVGMVVLGCALAGMVTFTVTFIATSLWWVAMALGLVVAPMPYAYVKMAARRRLRLFEEQFPQAVDLIAVSLRAGHAFTTGLLMVAEDVPDPLGAEFRLLHDQQNYGKPLPVVLKELAERVPLLDVRIFVTAVLTQRETGGNLAEVLDKLSAMIRERFTIRRQIKVVSAHGRATGWVLVALPPVVAVALFFLAPDHIMTLVRDPIGIQITAGAIVLQILGTVAIRRIVNIEL